MKTDYYKLLGVPRSASQEEIHTTYRNLLRVYHPDVYRGDPSVASVNTRALAEAYEALSDPDRRREIDRELDDAEKAASRPSEGPLAGGGGSSTTAKGAGSKEASKEPQKDPMGFQGEWPGVSPEIVKAWRESAYTPRPKRVLSKHFGRSLLVFLVASIALVGFCFLFPFNGSFALVVYDAGIVNIYGQCLTFESFPPSSTVTFSWDARYIAPQNGSNEPSPPRVLVYAPSGDLVYSQLSWTGSGSFQSSGGSYGFGVNGNCGSSSSYYAVNISGKYTYTIL